MLTGKLVTAVHVSCGVRVLGDEIGHINNCGVLTDKAGHCSACTLVVVYVC